MIRFREIEKWWRYRKFLENPWEVATSRRRAPSGSEVALRVRECGVCRIRAGSTDHRVFDDVFLNDVYDLELRREDRQSSTRWGTVVDVGAHVGLFAVRAARLAERVICCEPIEENRQLLEKNLASSGTANVVITPYAIGGHDGETEIHRSVNQAGHSLFKLLSGDGTKSNSVPIRRLETLCQEQGIDRIDLLKLDCEGAEYPILLSASDELLGRIDRIVLEYHDMGEDRGEHKIESLVDRLVSVGFRTTVVASRRNRQRGTLVASSQPE